MQQSCSTGSVKPKLGVPNMILCNQRIISEVGSGKSNSCLSKGVLHHCVVHIPDLVNHGARETTEANGGEAQCAARRIGGGVVQHIIPLPVISTIVGPGAAHRIADSEHTRFQLRCRSLPAHTFPIFYLPSSLGQDYHFHADSAHGRTLDSLHL